MTDFFLSGFKAGFLNTRTAVRPSGILLIFNIRRADMREIKLSGNKSICNKCGEPPENPRDLPMPLPKCPAHGAEMVLVQPQTEDQRFCGATYNCPYCGNTKVYTSKELRDFLRQLCTNKNCHLKQEG
jgi:predicted RNA-binding Zn-ribbon protein involved in translation (DUF1610 family)